jgi:hypothetical protein
MVQFISLKKTNLFWCSWRHKSRPHCLCFKRPLHSGHYGNWAPNPAMMLAQLLASMKDDDGRVTIKGFYDDVIPLVHRRN